MKTCLVNVLLSGLFTLIACGTAALFVVGGAGTPSDQWLINNWWLLWLITYAVLMTFHKIVDDIPA